MGCRHHSVRETSIPATNGTLRATCLDWSRPTTRSSPTSSLRLAASRLTAASSVKEERHAPAAEASVPAGSEGGTSQVALVADEAP